ncbi:hypothetical protein RJ640_002455 [Escallonia rubra]|uniref:Reverse transcriptase/retrotransposon-derived protein RNase H-like domain-containing protein n=1 Tax=Escallonia rubra TaxID=112253 RepID=A0AA88UFN0_9ASTE|nr:hypothetical protein RJ640_002455 [Escallonia rubra]
MDRLQTIEPKGPTIQDLQGEIISLKRDVKALSTRISLLELHNIEEVKSEEEEGEIYLNDNNNRLEINPDIINDTKIPSHSKEQKILSIDRVVFQKWYVSIKIVISKDFTFEGIALIDSGADLNCIKEGLVPTKSVEFASKFPDEIREKTQLQRFLGSLNYIADFYQDLYKDTKVLYQRLQKNPQPWTIVHTQAIRRIKLRAKTLPCLCLPLPEAFKIVETDASDIGYGGILKQKVDEAMLGKFENSGYNAHAHCPDIIQIEDEEQDLSPIEVVNNYFTNGWAYPQKASGKSRDYYEEILRSTKSAVLTHNFEKPPRHSSRNIELPFQFSKVEILKFITKKQWGIDPTRIRELPPHFSPRHFNYFDYIDAWNHVLLYQNPSHKHSWFIFFSRNFDGNFPNWIANWWLNYGPDFEEWPSTQVTEAYQLYAPMVKGLPKLQFMADFSIPWILCWQYAIQKSTNSSLEYPPSLVRQFGSKWWPKFDDSHCNIEAVTELFPTLKAASTKWKSYPKTKSHALHCEAEFSKRKNEILCRLSKEKPFLNKRELLQVVTFEMLKMSEEDYNADSDNSANSTKESSSGKEGSDEPITDNMSTGPTIDNILQTIEPKGPTIQDLQGEIISLKRDVKTLSTRISLLELHNIEEVKSEEEEGEIYLNDNNNRLEINPDIINDTKIPSHSKETKILSIDRVVFQKWYVSIKIVISKDFTFEGIALIDSGADLNCIKEGLVPTKSVEFASKFPDEIREKTQLQRFLGSLNYIADFYQDLYKDTKVLYQRLQKNPQPWTIVHTQAIRRIKLRAKTLPCLCLPLPEAFKIVETDASDIGYGGILKQKVDEAMLGKFENSGYNAHAHCPDIIQIEDEEQDLSPIEVVNNYFTNGWAYPQKASGKSRDYYEEILRSTKSAVLTHNFEKPPRHSSRNIELPFQFSKVEILKFITKKQWGIDPTRIRELPPHFSPRHFNYFDYIDAWNHVLLYQNPSHKHSWFIFFSRNFDGNFPNWIANWWLNYGPDFEEWPSTQVTEAYQLYAPMVKGLPKLQFMADFSIPWILCWQYAIQKSTNSSLEYPPSLVRQFGSKWWPKFDDSHCNIEAVTELFPTLKVASTKWKSYPKTKSHALHCEAEFSKRKNEILCRLSKEKPFLNKRELLQVVTFEMLKMSEEDYNADSDNSANSTKESSSGKEGSDEPITDNMSTGPTIDNILQTIEPKGPTIQDLQGEIISLKRDVKALSARISLLELHNIEEVKSEEEEGEIYLNDNNNRLEINPDIINDTKIPSHSKEQKILSIDRVVFQKWYVSIKIVISKDFTFEGIALIDSGADLNCIKEGLVPTKSVEFASKFPDEIREKTQLQRFLGSLNYIADFYQDLYKDTKVLYQRLQKNPQPWTIVHTQAIRRIKLRAKTLPCLCLPLPEAFKIVETDASDIGYGGILKQKVDGKMTPHRAYSPKSDKRLLPRPNRYNLRKSIGSSSSQSNQEAMLGKFENSGYNAHAHCPDIIQIEDEEQDLSPIEVVNNYFTNGWAYPQKASGKSRDYYEEILRSTKSAVLTHNFEKPPRHSSRNIELPFQFSKVEILKFITKKQWGIDPTRIRELPPHFSPRHFNYFDYIDAWNHVLLYQNPSHKHSWFIFFSRNFDGNFPNWIANWWLNYGPDFEEWPSTQVTEAYQLYAPMVKGLPKLQFMADFSIPWILCWQYAIQKSTNSSLEYPPSLVRQFGSKWWPKFDDSHCNIEAVTELFPTLKAASTKWKSYPKTKSHALHCEAEFSKRKNEILCRLSKEKPFLNKRELLQVVTFEMLKMSEEDYNADSDNSANSTKESSSGKEGSDEPITDNMSTGPTIDNI